MGGSAVRLRWKQVHAADGVVRAEAEKNEEENAPAGAEALISEQDTVDAASLGSALRGRSGEDVIRQSGGVGLREVRIVQGISSSSGMLCYCAEKLTGFEPYRPWA